MEKTHFSIDLALNFTNKGIRVIYMPYRYVITSVKQSLLDQEYYNKQLNKYKKAEILLIDDLFKGKINDTNINLGEILIQTVANVFKNPEIDYFEALQIIISNLEKENKLKAKKLLASLNEFINLN